MGVHRLRELRLESASPVLAAIWDFDFYNLREVERLLFLQEWDEDGPAVEMDVSYRGATGPRPIRLVFGGLRLLRLPELAPRFAFGELEVEDLSNDQLEGIRYRARDHLMSDFEVCCRTIGIALLR